MWCPHCGAELTQRFAYCPHCGKSLDEAPAPGESSETAPKTQPASETRPPLEPVSAPAPEATPVEAPAATPVPAPAPAPAQATPPNPEARDVEDLVNEENEERAETGAPPVPGGSSEKKGSHGGAVVAAVVIGVIAVLFVAIVVFAMKDVFAPKKTPTWVGTGSETTVSERPTSGNSGSGSSGGTSTPSLRPTSEDDAAGRYYAFWKYDDDEVWGYIFDLYADGTGEFHLFLSEDEDDFTRAEVDGEDYSEGLRWEQDGSTVVMLNPAGENTLPDAPNGYVLTGTAGRHVLSPSDPDTYQYPDEILYENYDEAVANMSD